jgi:hypothetical protein
MDIRIGRTPPAGGPAGRPAAPEGAVEARLLAVRPPRRRCVQPPPGAPERREAGGDERDPFNGRVLVLMIPDGSRLPPGLASGEYRVFLRFARR